MKERLKVGVWNAQVLFRELRERNFSGGYSTLTERLRPQSKVARDAYVSWQGSRYSVPWSYAGKDVWARGCGNSVELRHGAERIAAHDRAMSKHLVITHDRRHAGIPLGIKQCGKTLIHIVESAPQVERRSLAVYDCLAVGGAR